MKESPFKHLTPDNECQIREIQKASHRINNDPHNRDIQPLPEDRRSIIGDALIVTHAMDFSSALNGYYTMFKKWGYIDNPQCKVPSK